jgi:hypothetical protein
LHARRSARKFKAAKPILSTWSVAESIVFSYPHGLSYHYTDESVSLVREAGYQLACSSSAGFVSLHNDPLQMPRFIVSDCNGDQFAKQLTDWCREHGTQTY